MRKTLHCFVSGKVQGVCFRLSTERQANLMGLKGWIRNLRDGRVELMASGNETTIEQLRNWLRQGPKRAKVSKMQCEFVDVEEFPDFSIR